MLLPTIYLSFRQGSRTISRRTKKVQRFHSFVRDKIKDSASNFNLKIDYGNKKGDVINSAKCNSKKELLEYFSYFYDKDLFIDSEH